MENSIGGGAQTAGQGSTGMVAAGGAGTPLHIPGAENDGLDDNGDDLVDYEYSATDPAADPRDLKLWLRPPALVRVPLHGRLVPMQRYGQRKC